MSEPRVCVLLASELVTREDGMVRIPVSMVVRGYKGKQRFAVSASDLAQAVENFRKRKTGDLVIDYDHSTLSAGDGDPKPAAGWLKEIDDAPDADGVLWGWAELTARGKAMVAAREYKYVSPVMDWSIRDKETGEPQGATLTSLALTNSPLFERLPELPRIAASEAGWEFDRGDVVEVTQRQEKKTVAITRVILAAIAAGKVRLVADDNSESEHVVEGLKVHTLADVKRGADGLYDFSSVPQDALVASEVLHAQREQTEVNVELDGAIGKGLITPAQRPFYAKLAASDLAGFRELVKTMKPAVDLTERGVAGGDDTGGATELEKVEGMIGAKVREKLAADKTLQYHQALKLVASENPELDKRRTELQRQRFAGREE